MRSANFIVQFPETTQQAGYVEVAVESNSPLAGILAGAPVHVTMQNDTDCWGGGDGIVTARVVDQDLIRFRQCSPIEGLPVMVTVTELLP